MHAPRGGAKGASSRSASLTLQRQKATVLLVLGRDEAGPDEFGHGRPLSYDELRKFCGRAAQRYLTDLPQALLHRWLLKTGAHGRMDRLQRGLRRSSRGPEPDPIRPDEARRALFGDSRHIGKVRQPICRCDGQSTQPALLHQRNRRWESRKCEFSVAVSAVVKLTHVPFEI